MAKRLRVLSFRRLFVSATVAVALAVAVAAIVQTPAAGGSKPSPGRSSADVTVSPSGSDRECRPGDLSRPCGSFDRAYRLARCGDVVAVAAGVYGGQTVDYDGSKSCAGEPVVFEGAGVAATFVGARTKTTADVDLFNGGDIPVVSTAGFHHDASGSYELAFGFVSTFTCAGATATSFTGCHADSTCQATSGDECGWAAGTDVHEAGLKVFASDITFRNMTIQVWSAKTDGSHPVSHVTFDSDQLYFGYSKASYTTVSNSTCGPSTANDICAYIESSDHFSFVHNVVHGYTHNCIATPNQPNANKFCHGDAFYIHGQTSNLTYAYNVSYGNDPWTLFFSSEGDYSGLSIKNNFFGIDAATYVMSLRSGSNQTWSNVRIEGNSFAQGTAIGTMSGATGVAFSNWLITGNIGITEPEACPLSNPSAYTSYDMTYDYNVTSGAACASSFVQAMANVGGQTLGTSAWTSPSTGDLHLLSTFTAADNIWRCRLADDFDADARSVDLGCDAGADER